MFLRRLKKKKERSQRLIFGDVAINQQIASAASGYFLCNDLLFWKWVPVGEDAVKADVFQLVVPSSGAQVPKI